MVSDIQYVESQHFQTQKPEVTVLMQLDCASETVSQKSCGMLNSFMCSL